MKTHDNEITEHQNITKLMLAPYLKNIVPD